MYKYAVAIEKTIVEKYSYEQYENLLLRINEEIRLRDIERRVDEEVAVL